MNSLKKIFLFFSFLFILSGSLYAADQNSSKRILIASPVHQKASILQQFLNSLNRLDPEGLTIDYYFIDDNESALSSELLNQFSEDKKAGQCLVIPSGRDGTCSTYVCTEFMHVWKEELIWKVAGFKDQMIEHAKNQDYDYLFLIDSDIVMHPKTIHQLIKANKDIISNIFWTSWQPGTREMPQVWLTDFYTQYEVKPGENLTPEQISQRISEFYEMLRVPGTYEIGGLGACTLISKNALQYPINFRKIKNITFWGEDRHFCVRASALGIPLFVDTHYPSYHIYRESALSGVPEYVEKCKQTEEDAEKPLRITLSMVVKNEADRYLRQVLENAKTYITDAVIIDDGSTDNSVQMCREILHNIPLHLVQNKVSKFSNEHELRRQQWEETAKVNPDWIVILDADEIFENKFAVDVQELIKKPNVDAYYFRLYDFWDENHYRDDRFWQAHNYFRPFLIRYRPEMSYVWNETAQHSGRLPKNINQLPYELSPLRLKHYGWSRKEDREAKYDRYMKLDPGAKFGWKEQYESILDPNPSLVAWQE